MSIEEQLSQTFQPSDKSEWKKAASAELGGGDPFETLQWQTADGLTFGPYYDASDTAPLSDLHHFQLKNAKGNVAPRTWSTLSHVTVTTESEANVQALDHLQHEADGIVFTLPSRAIDFDTLLNKIEWPHCSISFIVEKDFILDSLNEYIIKNGYTDKQLTGGCYWKTLPVALPSLLKINSFKSLGIHVEQGGPTDELSSGLIQASQFLYRIQEENQLTEEIVNNISFSISVGSNFLVELGKLKSLRLLWYQVTQAFAIKNFRPEHLHLLTRSEVWVNEKFQPHGNLLKSTVSTMAAIAGGCNANVIFAESETDRTVTRMARNNAFILRDEAHFNKVADPFAGAYVVETIIQKISQQAWEKFQNQVNVNQFGYEARFQVNNL